MTSCPHQPAARRAPSGSTARRAVAVTLLGLTALLASTLPAGAAPGERYVALGDSYSAGTGTRDYLADGTDCDRSLSAFPSLVASRNSLALDLVACQSAVTADVLADQLGALDRSTDYVTITIGGNDVGFGDVLTECAKPGWLSDCDAAIDQGRDVLTTELPGRLDAVLAGITAGAPQAEVVVVGYPRLFMGEDCNAATFFSPAEQQRLNDSSDDLAALTRARAGAAGATFVDPTAAFTGHAVCGDPEWVNGLSNPVRDSYHPNAAGHVGYAALVEPALLGSTASSDQTTPDQTTPDQTTPDQTDRAGTLRAGTVRTDPGVTSAGSFAFEVTDLDSPEIREASLSAGVTRAELQSVVVAQRAGDEVELERLDRVITERAEARR